jgi:transcriptional regulator of arginine metabolism
MSAGSGPPAPQRGFQRRERQGAILRLIRERGISTQAELAEALREAGMEVVQTTVSRDVHELGLVKVRAADGRLVYAEPGSVTDAERVAELKGALRRWALSLESSGNLVVVLTPAGFSNALAQVIDDARLPSIAGTIAGENTVLVVARESVSGARLVDELRSHLTEGAGAIDPVDRRAGHRFPETVRGAA